MNMDNTQRMSPGSEAIFTQVMPQIQNTTRCSQDADKGNSQVEKPERRSEYQKNHHRVKPSLLVAPARHLQGQPK